MQWRGSSETASALSDSDSMVVKIASSSRCLIGHMGEAAWAHPDISSRTWIMGNIGPRGANHLMRREVTP